MNGIRPYDWLSYWIYVVLGGGLGAVLQLLLWLRLEGRAEVHGFHTSVPLGLSAFVAALNLGAWAGYLRDRLWLNDMMTNDDGVHLPPVSVRVTAWGITGLTLGFVGQSLVRSGVRAWRVNPVGLDRLGLVLLVALPIMAGIAGMCGGLYFLIRIGGVSGGPKSRSESGGGTAT